MKKIIVLVSLLISGFAMHAQGQEAYMKAMGKALSTLGSDPQSAAGQFERIAAKVKDQWHPHYYAALSYINMSFNAADLKTKDELTTKAQTYIDAALKLQPNNAEVVALQGYNYMAQLAADPGSRGQMLSPKAMQQFGKAVSMAPENPRAMALMAQMQYGTAQFFGSPTDKPCEMVRKSIPIFEAEEKGKSFDPTWGKEMAEGLVGQCDK